MIQFKLFETDRSKFYIKKIKRAEAITLLSQFHYLRSCSNNASCFGAFENDRLAAVVAFMIPCSERVRASLFGEEYKDDVIELGRLCLHPECKTPASKIVSQAIKALQEYRVSINKNEYRAILSFADFQQGHHGGVYQAMSWLYCGTSKKGQRYYTDQNGAIKHQRQCGKTITLKEARKLGWNAHRSTAVKYRYIKLLGTKKQKRKYKRLLLFDILDYPKTQESRRIASDAFI